MQINVAQLLKGPMGTRRVYRVDDEIDFSGEGDTCRAHGEVLLTRTNRSVLVQADIHTHAELDCSRCLEKFTCPLDLRIEEEFFPKIDIQTGLSVAPPEEPGAFFIDKHHVIDLTEAIRQHSLLGLPMKPLCREDCPGICPECGKNLKQGPCGCPRQEKDHRLDKLLEITEKRRKQKYGTTTKAKRL